MNQQLKLEPSITPPTMHDTTALTAGPGDSTTYNTNNMVIGTYTKLMSGPEDTTSNMATHSEEEWGDYKLGRYYLNC